MDRKPQFRVGQGYDIHPLVADRPLVLGGVRIPFERGLAGVSDADVLLHALGDALLGAVGRGDLGSHFPPADPQWRDADSADLLRRILYLVRDEGYYPVNCDLTLVAEAPTIAPYREEIRLRIANLLELPVEAVSLKATTHEGLGPVGRGEALAALAVVLVGRSR